MISNNITVNIEFGWGIAGSLTLSGSGNAVAESQAAWDYVYKPTTSSTQFIESALLAAYNANGLSSAVSASTLNSLLSNVANTATWFEASYPQALALGIANQFTGVPTSTTGYVVVNPSYAYNYDVNSTPNPSSFDLVAALLHEITHDLGRTAGFLSSGGLVSTVFDLFRYSSTGTPLESTPGGGWFSLNGSSLFLPFDSQSDPADWSSNVSNDANGYGVYGSSTYLYSQTDMIELEALGFQLGATPAAIQNDFLAITRASVPLDQATNISNAINAGTQTQLGYVNSLLSQVANTTIPAVGVEASMHGLTGTSAEITKLVTQFLPPQITTAVQNGFNPQVYASEALGVVFAFGNETGSTAFATNFGPGKAGMSNSVTGDAAFANAAVTAIFGSSATTNLDNVMQQFVSNWKAFYTANGVAGIAAATADQIDIAARGTSWGDMTGIALANNLGPLSAQVTNFLEDAAQGTAIYGASLIGQPAHAVFG